MSDKKSKSKSPASGAKADPAKAKPSKRAHDTKATNVADEAIAAMTAAEAEAAKAAAEADARGESPAEPPAGGPGGAGQKSGWSTGELEALRGENADLKDRLLRAVAEMENLRRRTERDKADTSKYAISNFARDVLTIADNIALAIGHVPEEALEKDDVLKNFRDGIMVTERELLNMMERHGITRVDPKGERFDPNQHQAMFEIPNPDVPEGTIMEVIQAGYVIADRVLRPAMVGVAKGGAKQPKADPAAAEQDTPKAANDDIPGGPKPSGDEPGGKDIGGNVDKSA